jgi:hypothetical protein
VACWLRPAVLAGTAVGFCCCAPVLGPAGLMLPAGLRLWWPDAHCCTHRGLEPPQSWLERVWHRSCAVDAPKASCTHRGTPAARPSRYLCCTAPNESLGA